jgi:hypothetical protein
VTVGARSKLGRRIRELFIHDWLEIFLTVLGFVFFVLTALCVVALVVDLATWNDPATGFSAGEGILKLSKGFALALFSVGAVITAAVGWTLAGPAIRDRVRAVGRSLRRSSRPR